MVGQHDAAGAYADRRGRGGDMADDHRGCRACDARHVVMLGQPVAHEAESFGQPREIGSVGQRFGGRAAFDDGREIEYGELGHGVHIGAADARAKPLIERPPRGGQRLPCALAERPPSRRSRSPSSGSNAP